MPTDGENSADERGLRTPLCTTLGIDLPIVQAPIGRVSSPELAAAVANAGGLGMLGLGFAAEGASRAAIRRTRSLTDRPFGVNLILKFDQRQRLAECLAAGATLVSYHWGELAEGSPYIEGPHAAGALVMLTVGSAREAERAVTAGVDIVVAQGLDAGGHVWGSVGTMALVPVLVDAVAPTPVIAAGGIGDGRGLVAALALGAEAAWMGTRFVVADECLADDGYKDRLIAANETDAVWSMGVFDIGFEDSPVRTLDNSTLRALRSAGMGRAEARIHEGEIVAHRPGGEPIARYESVLPIAGMSGDLEALPNFAGQSVGLVRKRQPAAEIVRDLVDEAMAALDQLVLTATRRSARYPATGGQQL